MSVPVAHPSSLIELIYHDPERKRSQILEKLLARPREEVIERLRIAIRDRRRQAVWILNADLTRRGMPPAFRPSVWFDGKPRIPIEDILLLDLQWIADRYPRQKTHTKRWQKLFSPQTFFDTAHWITIRMPKPAGFFVGGLKLTESQQLETSMLLCKPAQARRLKVNQQSKGVYEALKQHHNQNPRTRIQDGPEKTIERRHHIWHCASLAHWLPQPTAKMYESKTGIAMSRQNAGKIIGEVLKVIPEAKPPKPRARKPKEKERKMANVTKRKLRRTNPIPC